MLNSALVSVIMPAYNVQNYIAASIDSVVAQTYSNWELLVVDDGSTDDTAHVVKQHPDERIRYFYQPNAGPGSARNTAIANAGGEYIAFLDADDLWLPEKLTVSMQIMSESNCDLVFTNCYLFDDNQLQPATLTDVGVNTASYKGEAGLLSFLESNRIPTLTVLAKKKVVKQAGLFNNFRAAEDYDMWLRLLYNGASFRADSRCLSVYRMRSNSITASDRVALFESMRILKNFALQHPQYKAAILTLLRSKFKNWLYYGHQPNAFKYRKIMPGIYSPLADFLLYPLSFILPFKYIRKLTNRLV
jgi:teichuronic acid biosynthesis glycosyltransferase TuaG